MKDGLLYEELKHHSKTQNMHFKTLMPTTQMLGDEEMEINDTR